MGKKSVHRTTRQNVLLKNNEKRITFCSRISGREKKDIKHLLNLFKLINLDSQIAEKSSEIIKNHNIMVNDAIIASTAIVKDMTLITRNYKHFKNIPGIKLYEIDKK